MGIFSGIETNVILGNIASLVACTVMVFIGFIKNKDRYIVMQNIQFALNGTSHLLLGGFGGAIASGISIIRNIITSKREITVQIKIALIVLQTVLSISTVTLNPITWLPIIAAGMFTWYIDTKDVMWFKWVIIITLIMWGIYDIYHQNYVSIWFRIFTIVSNGISMVQIRKKQKSEKQN